MCKHVLSEQARDEQEQTGLIDAFSSLPLMSLFNLVAESSMVTCSSPSWARSNGDSGHLSTIVSPGEQSQVREGAAAMDPRPTDGGHGKPSLSPVRAGASSGLGLHTERRDAGPQGGLHARRRESGGCPFKDSTRETASQSMPTRLPGQGLAHCPSPVSPHAQVGQWQSG